MRRVVSGTEVTLTPESIDALAVASQDLALDSPGEEAYASPAHNAEASHIFFPSMVEDDASWERITEQFPLRGLGHNRSMNMATQSLPVRPKSPNVASGLRTNLDLTFLGGMDPFSSLPSDNSTGEPVLTQLLVHYFAMRLAPWLSYLDDSMTETSPRMAWLPYALNHTPLFYATLLVAAVHLDRRQPMTDRSALLRLKGETIRLANENMDDPFEAVSDQMMMVAFILLYFNVGGDNLGEFEIHLNGINQMLFLRGGKGNLGMNGMPKNWLEVCHGPWQDDWEDGAFSI
ncbi:hypothetical protein LSUB1_G007268 [Lachnellula subtilissima]|uniref:Transcription factor domain-containing protein n=1 Tax=Lachnellula subtilissima TaxID=602034 RepID=A0A8H8RQK1_9HELO|nr:hypothetical protein LSUB1_G007268 [Lachnellula subtilissima]